MNDRTVGAARLSCQPIPSSIPSSAFGRQCIGEHTTVALNTVAKVTLHDSRTPTMPGQVLPVARGRPPHPEAGTFAA